VHRRDFPGRDDLAPGQRTAVFYDKLVANRKVMYFAPGPSADFDHDGRLDLFLCSWWPKFPSMLLHNETPGGHYLAVRVVGSNGVNRMGIGSMVRAYVAGHADEAKALLASEPIATNYGFCSAQPPVAHLGLGKATRCDLVITLPCGKGRIVRTNVDVNQWLTVKVGQ
jgi:enediyne biosynthesis protein E4